MLNDKETPVVAGRNENVAAATLLSLHVWNNE